MDKQALALALENAEPLYIRDTNGSGQAHRHWVISEAMREELLRLMDEPGGKPMRRGQKARR